MNNLGFVSPDEIRALFSSAMSAMYKSEVPLYGTLLDLVAQTNEKVMDDAPEVAEQLLGAERARALRRHPATLHTRLLCTP